MFLRVYKLVYDLQYVRVLVSVKLALCKLTYRGLFSLNDGCQVKVINDQFNKEFE